MELDNYLRLFRKWYWLLILAGIIASVVGYAFSSRQQTMYQASSMVIIGNVMESGNPDANDFRLGIDLVQTYAQLAQTNRILGLTIEALDLPLSTGQLGDAISVTPIVGTSLLSLTVAYDDPDIAVAIANKIAQALVENSPTNLTNDQSEQVSLIEEQLNELSIQIDDLTGRLQLVDSQLAAARDASIIADLQAQREVLVDQIGNARATVAQFASTLTDLQVRRNSVEIMELAEEAEPLPSSPVTTAIGAAVVAIFTAFGVVILVEYLDDRVQNVDEVETALNLPVLTSVRRYGHVKQKVEPKVGQVEGIPPDVVESFRWLSARLARESARNPEQNNDIIVVTSPGVDDGKSTTVVHLGIQMASMGKRVLILDADVRQPSLHKFFNLPNEEGLTTLTNMIANASWNGNGSKEKTSYDDIDYDSTDRKFTTLIRRCVQPSAMRNLQVMTSGPIDTQSTKLIDTYFDRTAIELLRFETGADIILCDTPPCLVVTDTCALAAKLNARVILVLHAGRARLGAAHRALDLLQQFDVSVEGVVLNKSKSHKSVMRHSY